MITMRKYVIPAILALGIGCSKPMVEPKAEDFKLTSLFADLSSVGGRTHIYDINGDGRIDVITNRETSICFYAPEFVNYCNGNDKYPLSESASIRATEVLASAGLLEYELTKSKFDAQKAKEKANAEK